MDQAAAQVRLPFPVDKSQCAAFLTEYLTLADEMDRLRAQMQGLVEEFTDTLPLRAVRTAIKVIRARKKLAEHPKEPCTYANQALIEEVVRGHLTALDAAKQRAADELAQAGAMRQRALAQRPVPDLAQAEG